MVSEILSFIKSAFKEYDVHTFGAVVYLCWLHLKSDKALALHVEKTKGKLQTFGATLVAVSKQVEKQDNQIDDLEDDVGELKGSMNILTH